MKKTTKKVLSIILSLLLLISTIPLTAFAADGDVIVSYDPNTDCYAQAEVISEKEKTCKLLGMDVIERDYGELKIPSEVNGYKVVSVDWDAFYYVPINVPGVIVPDSIKDFRNMFDDNQFVQHIELGSGFESFDTDLFSGLSALEKITISENHPDYCTVDGVVFDKDMQTLVFYPENKRGYAYAIPEGVTVIGEGAFQNVKNLKKLYIPDTVTTLKDDAFADCTALTEIYHRNNAKFEEPDFEYEILANNKIRLTYYNDNSTKVVVPEIIDNYIVSEIDSNVIILEKTIVSAMSSQIRFNMKDDGTYKGTFDVRTRAKSTDADFAKYIAGSNNEAARKITKIGFVYSTTATEFDIESAKLVAQGQKVSGFIDAPVKYVQDADGYYMFTCLVTGISENDLSNGLINYAYVCVNDIWYFFPIETTTEFEDLYDTYYPLAVEQYGWET